MSVRWGYPTALARRLKLPLEVPGHLASMPPQNGSVREVVRGRMLDSAVATVELRLLPPTADRTKRPPSQERTGPYTILFSIFADRRKSNKPDSVRV